MNNTSVDNTKIQCLESLYNSILMQNSDSKEVLESMMQQVAIYLANRNMNFCISAEELRNVLGISPNTIVEAKRNLEERGGFSLIKRKYYPIHITAIISELAEMEKQQQLI